MTEDFVPFELAKKLKEKGYPQIEKNTIAMYDEDGCLSYLCPTFDINRYYYSFDDFDEHDCVCPSISQVLKWLRKEKQLHIVIVTGHNIVTNTHLWGYKIWDLANHVWLHAKIADDSYELAALSGIEFVIDNLIL